MRMEIGTAGRFQVWRLERLLLGRDGEDNINGQGGNAVAGNEGADIIVADPGEINEQFSLASLGTSFLNSLGIVL